MSELTLKFNLPEEETEAKRAMNAQLVHVLLWEFDQSLRAVIKYDQTNTLNLDTISERDKEVIMKVRSYLNDLLIENNIEI